MPTANNTTDERGAGFAQRITAEIKPGDTAQVLPEFGRIADVERIYGLKRGITYSLIHAGKLKSVCLRKPGAKTGVRLVHLASVRTFLEANLQ
jgi:hypothetical protein